MDLTKGTITHEEKKAKKGEDTLSQEEEMEGNVNDSMDMGSVLTVDGDIASPEENNSKKEENEISKEEGERPRGLSQFCESLLGKPLDKTEQCSVWNRRPLRPLQVACFSAVLIANIVQLRYAALDAYCLLLLFERCRAMAASMGRDVVEMANALASPETSLPLFFGDK
jgi:hypothetical protein